MRFEFHLYAQRARVGHTFRELEVDLGRKYSRGKRGGERERKKKKKKEELRGRVSNNKGERGRRRGEKKNGRGRRKRE